MDRLDQDLVRFLPLVFFALRNAQSHRGDPSLNKLRQAGRAVALVRVDVELIHYGDDGFDQRMGKRQATRVPAEETAFGLQLFQAGMQ